MRMNFTQSTRVAIKAANDFLAGKFGEIPDWAVDLAFFSRLEAGEKTLGCDMEIVSREFVFFVDRVSVLKVDVEAVAFNADEFGDFSLAKLQFHDGTTWKKVELPVE